MRNLLKMEHSFISSSKNQKTQERNLERLCQWQFFFLLRWGGWEPKGKKVLPGTLPRLSISFRFTSSLSPLRSRVNFISFGDFSADSSRVFFILLSCVSYPSSVDGRDGTGQGRGGKKFSAIWTVHKSQCFNEKPRWPVLGRPKIKLKDTKRRAEKSFSRKQQHETEQARLII